MSNLDIRHPADPPQKWNVLGRTQEDFTEALYQLIGFALKNGIRLRIKDAYRDPRVHGAWGEKKGYGAAHSVHKLSLAVDLWTLDADNHRFLHDYWDKIGGAPRIENDMNHYSFMWMGYW